MLNQCRNTHIDSLVGGLHQSVDLIISKPALSTTAITVPSEKSLSCLLGGIHVADIVVGEHKKLVSNYNRHPYLIHHT